MLAANKMRGCDDPQNDGNPYGRKIRLHYFF